MAALVVTTAATLVATGVSVDPAGASPPGQVYVSEPFTGANVQIPADWVLPGITGGTDDSCMTASANVSQTPVPGCNLATPDSPGSGTLRLTSVAGNETGGVAYTSSVLSGQGVDVTFQHLPIRWHRCGRDLVFSWPARTPHRRPRRPRSVRPVATLVIRAGAPIRAATAWPTGISVSDSMSSGTSPTISSTGVDAPIRAGPVTASPCPTRSPSAAPAAPRPATASCRAPTGRVG